MKSVESDSVKEDLVDIREVEIDSSLSAEEKIRSYIEQIKNPYRFKVGSVVVRVSYAGKEETLNDQFSHMLAVM